MWLSTTKMGSSQCFLVSRFISSLYKIIIAGSGFILVVTAGSLILGYIFFTLMTLTVSTLFFALVFYKNPKKFIQNCEEDDDECSEAKVECKYIEEVNESVEEQVAEKEEGGCESIQKALNFLATISEEDSICNDEDNDHCFTTSEDDYVARSSLSSDDGSISDEDTLIEIELPTGHYLSPKRHKMKPRWMELISEANSELTTEEDNLIEIDISIGSIMHPRFEIEA